MGKCVDGRYENIFLEGLSLREVFEFGGLSRLLGLQIARKLSEDKPKG